jgi:hypothetical protein
MFARPLHKALWAAALAVLIQLGAPVWAMSMLAVGAFDPIVGMPICSHDTGPDRARPSSHHGSICPICQFAGQARQLVLSSQALPELPRWGELIREKPGVDVVMVAADPVVAEGKAIAGALAKAGCAAVESWIFADPFTERLAYEVDPSWVGELPYTLLVAADGSATAILGEVEFSELRAWVAEQAHGATGGRS